jgi:hypothetical protein
MRVRNAVALAVVAAACMVSSGDAHAFCRTMTCPLPPSWSPINGCYPPDFATLCAPAKLLPVWWRNECVSYDVQKNASRWIPYDKAVGIVDAAFVKWTGAVCPADASGATRVSIDATNLGAVECTQVGYKKNGTPNQHVIVFRDDTWPYPNDSNNTLGLTTLTFNVDTGEIYDADTEINGTLPLSSTDPVPAGSYDFESIVTHEMGHFLGLAHSGYSSATMYARYTPGSTSMRSLTPDDVAGLCAIYPPDKTRVVDPAVSAGGSVAADACNPTPRHGFSSVCDPPQSSGGCSVASWKASRGPAPFALAMVLAWLGVSRRSARRQRSSRRGSAKSTRAVVSASPSIRSQRNSATNGPSFSAR